MKFNIEDFPTSESALRMLDTVTKGFYDNSYVAKWLYQVMGLEMDKVLRIVGELTEQIFPETATWGLMYHEQKWQLPIRENLSYEERRRLIYQKRDYRAPITPYKMEKYLSDATGFKVVVADINDPGEYVFTAPHPNVFKVYFIGEGTLDLKQAYNMINQMKQSHTTYTVRDGMDINVNNSDLEQIVLRETHFWIKIPFWNEYVYDGSWLLDGNIILGQKRRYGLVLGLKFNQGGFYIPEQINLISAKFAMQTNIEEFFNVGVKYHFGINFWNILCFDGSWNLDAILMLEEKRRYGLHLDMGHRLSLKSNSENVKLHVLSAKWKQHIRENMIEKIAYSFTSDFWRILYLNGEVPLDGKHPLNFNRCRDKATLTLRSELDMSEQETVTNVTVETKTRDYWFLNGTLSLDGTRNLNSIYRKEMV